jgi:hypothetical protein
MKAAPIHFEGKIVGYMIQCPGCGNGHFFDSRWTFNGNYEKPTFTPSMFVSKDDVSMQCHSVVTDGMIAFQGECFHALKSQTVALQDIDGIYE